MLAQICDRFWVSKILSDSIEVFIVENEKQLIDFNSIWIK